MGTVFTNPSMEVAAALLDASRKVSNSDVSNWSSSTSEVSDKTGELPNSNSWLGGWGKRARSFSESSSAPDRLDTVTWLGGWAIPKKNSSTGVTPNNTPNMSSGFLMPERPSIRRSSSKDVEEAMAGELGKADMYLPPM